MDDSRTERILKAADDYALAAQREQSAADALKGATGEEFTRAMDRHSIAFDCLMDARRALAAAAECAGPLTYPDGLFPAESL